VLGIGMFAAFVAGVSAKPLADAARALEKEPRKIEAIVSALKGLDWRIKAAIVAVLAVIAANYVAYGILQIPSDLDSFRPEARAGLLPTVLLGIGIGLVLVVRL